MEELEDGLFFLLFGLGMFSLKSAVYICAVFLCRVTKLFASFCTVTDLHSNCHIPLVLMNYWPPTCERNLTLCPHHLQVRYSIYNTVYNVL